MVHESNIPPGRGQVAALAPVRRLWMRLRFARSRHGVVTADTLLRRALESSIDMTVGAGNAGVRADERKSSQKMIE
jgi:hypothetical protein